MLYRSLFVLLSFFIGRYICLSFFIGRYICLSFFIGRYISLSFFEWRLSITRFLSSNVSYYPISCQNKAINWHSIFFVCFVSDLFLICFKIIGLSLVIQSIDSFNTDRQIFPPTRFLDQNSQRTDKDLITKVTTGGGQASLITDEQMSSLELAFYYSNQSLYDYVSLIIIPYPLVATSADSVPSSYLVRIMILELLSEIFNEGGIKIISLSNIRPIIIYFHSSQCRLIPYLHQRPIFLKTNSSIVAIFELIRGAQCLIEVIRSSGEEMWRVDAYQILYYSRGIEGEKRTHPRFADWYLILTFILHSILLFYFLWSGVDHIIPQNLPVTSIR